MLTAYRALLPKLHAYHLMHDIITSLVISVKNFLFLLLECLNVSDSSCAW